MLIIALVELLFNNLKILMEISSRIPMEMLNQQLPAPSWLTIDQQEAANSTLMMIGPQAPVNSW